MRKLRSFSGLSVGGLVLAFVAAVFVYGLGAQEASAKKPDGPPGQVACPEGGTKIDEEGPSEFRCGEGQVVTGICVKAGVPGYGVGDGETENGAGCYEYGELGGGIGSVDGGGTSSECKDISYSVYYCGPGEPQEPVCGNEVLEQGEECDPPGRINENLVCNDVCEVVESPEPEEPVCGNEIVEAGEDCDPPGRIDETFVCTADCQVNEDPEEGEGGE
jgi:hypothetical protein